jgi:hypothetical protein
MIACNDYILLECALYRVLRLHFADHASYTALLDLFHEVGRGGEGGAPRARPLPRDRGRLWCRSPLGAGARPRAARLICRPGCPALQVATGGLMDATPRNRPESAPPAR